MDQGKVSIQASYECHPIVRRRSRPLHKQLKMQTMIPDGCPGSAKKAFSMNSHLAAAFCALVVTARSAEPSGAADFVFGKQLALKSLVLGEDRSIQIFTPRDYESAKSSYPTLPVLYLLDGTDHFVHVSGLADYLARKGRMPPMIVVAIGNTERTRDLTPTHALQDPNGKISQDFETSGGAARFFEFMRDELIPHVEKHYRTAPFRILAGHSFGGLFAMKVLLESPTTFQAYLAVSPSLWWDNRIMLKSTGPIGQASRFLFMSVGNEGGEHRKSIDLFVDGLNERAASGFVWTFKSYEDESHGSVPHITLYDALKFVFAGWHLPDRRIDAEPVSYAEAVAHYRALSEKYGYTIPLPYAASRDVAEMFAFHQRWDEAIAAYQEAIHAYSSSAGYDGLARVFARQGDKESAIRNYQKALELNPKSVSAKKALEKLSTKTVPQ